jgi:hypothetical protein
MHIVAHSPHPQERVDLLLVFVAGLTWDNRSSPAKSGKYKYLMPSAVGGKTGTWCVCVCVWERECEDAAVSYSCMRP